MKVILKSKSINQIKKELGIEKKGKAQKFLDITVRNNLMPYVSFRTGKQEQSIKLNTVPRKWRSSYWCSLCRNSSICTMD